MAAALFVPRYAARQRNDGAALAAPHLRHHLDRLALFFQPGPDAGDEEVRSRAENQNLSGTDVRRDGMVSLLGVRDRAGWLALFLDSSVRGRETCGRSFADWQVVWLVAAGVARRVYIHLRAAAPREGNLRQRVVPSRGRFYCGDCRLLAGARSEWRAQRFQCPPKRNASCAGTISPLELRSGCPFRCSSSWAPPATTRFSAPSGDKSGRRRLCPTKKNYNVLTTEMGVPIKAWTKGVQLEDQARKQLLNVAQLPFIFKWVAAMPDVHWGVGATVGSVIPTKGAIIPAAVGVDIGCGMMAVQTDLNARDLPDNLKNIRSAIEKAVPHGRTNHGGRGDVGAWGEIPARNNEVWQTLKPRYDAILEKHPKLDRGNHSNHLGTLGTGNHFIEVCLDEAESVWFMLHSGSRGVGNRM